MKKLLLCFGLVTAFMFSSCDQIDRWLTGQDPLPSDVTFVIVPGCGSQLTDVYESVFCRQVPREIPVYRYRFIVKDAATNTLVGTVDSPINRFSFVDLGIDNFELGKTYLIEVQVAFDASLNFTSVINPPCTLRTPDLPNKSRIVSPACGSEINSLWRTIFALQSLGAEKYKFVVRSGSVTREIETTKSSFQLPFLTGGAAANTEYIIRVDVLYQGIWYQGTEQCSVFTSPTATLRQSFEPADSSQK